MAKIIILLIIIFTLFTAYSSRPEDKTCIIEAVKSVWGKFVPDISRPVYYEQFMNETSKAVKIDNWVFLKRIQYKTNDGFLTVGYAAFNKVFTIKAIHIAK